MTQVTIQQAMQMAIQRHQAGHLPEAEGIYRQVLAQLPNHPEALHYLGVIAHQSGRNEVAVELIRRSIQLKPDYAAAYSNLGIALKEQEKFDEAVAAYRRAIELEPAAADAYSNLGIALKGQGKLDEAVAACRKAIALNPEYPQAMINMAAALHEQGKFQEAEEICRRAIQIVPTLAEAHGNLGNALRDQGKLAEAVAAYLHALALKPANAEVCNNLGNAYRLLGKFEEATAAYRKTIAIKPSAGRAYNNLGNVMKDQGCLDEALKCYERAVSLMPDNPWCHSNLIYSLYFHPDYDAAAIHKAHRNWNDRHARPLQHLIAQHTNDPDSERPLKIGYVSPDFRDHVVGRNLLPLFREHARDEFKVFCYSDVLQSDEHTKQFQSFADGWRNIVGLSDQRVAELVREDQIDILVDLTLHMARSRLLIFARKPAPVQLTFAGYPGTTGLDAMDYRLTDPYLDPPGQGDEFYSEQSIRLPESFWCYDPAVMTDAANGDAQVRALPALTNGVITFGCFNNYCKANERVLAVWAKGLNSIANSRMMLMVPQGSARQLTLDILCREGINPARIEFVDMAPRYDYLRRYDLIDIGLDTFPYNGHTTSLDALWMGVPVVTLAGRTVVGRAGVSQLTNLGLAELVANSQEQYVQIATELARDLPRLSVLRAGLRQRMRQSPLTDAPKFARNIESAYRGMWRTWCQSYSQLPKDD